jgi:DHA1 family bicyclomycin/chloramphenicol resistance-like MFS transporter
MTVAGWAQPAMVAALLMAVALAFGMTMPNIMNATMQPLPDIAGAVGAAAGSIQMTAGAASSGLVAVLFDGRSALSMAAVMATSSALALIAYCLLARPAERRIHSLGVEAPAAIEGAAHSQGCATHSFGQGARISRRTPLVGAELAPVPSPASPRRNILVRLQRR